MGAGTTTAGPQTAHGGASASSAKTFTDMAAEAIDRVWAEPLQAKALAVEAQAGARREGDATALSMAEHALGLVAYEQQDLNGSLAHLRRAIEVAQRNGLAICEAQARRSIMGTLAHLGDLRGALREADWAAPALRGAELARLEVHRGQVLVYEGRLDEASACFRHALPVLRRAGDRLWLALAYWDRSYLHFRRGDLAAAEADLRRAEALHVELGLHRYATIDLQHLAILAARRGDVPSALSLFDEAEAYFAERGEVDSIGMYDRCESLLAARLTTDLRETAERAIAALEAEGRRGYVAEVRLMLAEAALLAGDPATARVAADRARRAFSRQGRPTFVALARHLSVRAAWLAGDRSTALLAAARKAAAGLAEAGFA
ncbi:MAG: tetratricopeptide repeat protein, partial [Actinomycetota bacterium]|nr:tetratricopeptide repeat protein [Actinomycetota bacterium]